MQPLNVRISYRFQTLPVSCERGLNALQYFPYKTCIIVMVLLFLLLQVMEDFFENNPADRVYTSEVISKSRDLYPDTQKLISSLNRFTG